MSTFDSKLAKLSEQIKLGGLKSPGLSPNSTFAYSSVMSMQFDWTWHWYYVFYFLFVYQLGAILWRFWWKAPSNVIIAAYPTILGRWLTALHMIVDAESLLHNAYKSSNGKPFAIPMIDRWIIFVTNKEELKQLESEPESLLSMEHALNELGFTNLVLGPFALIPEKDKIKSENFRVMIGVLKNKLRSNLPDMTNSFRLRINESIDLEYENGTRLNSHEEWRKIRLMPAFLRIFTRVNITTFLGEEQGTRPEVYKLVMDFYWSIGRALPFLNLIPAWLLPMIAPVLMGWGVARAKVFRLLHLMTHETISGEEAKRNPGARGHLTRWVAEMSRLDDIAETAKVTIGLLFASAFQVPMVSQFMIHSLCKHRDYHDRLREEALRYKDAPFGRVNQDMPLLDSFMRETVRLSPGIILSAPRLIMAPYTSYNQGYHSPAGNWLAIPQVSLMRDEKIWPNASEFDGFRYVDADGNSEDRFTHPAYDFPFWGSLRHSCPARFYVSVILKLILGHLITDYEFKLENPDKKPFMTFGHTRLPSPFLSILIRKRPAEECVPIRSSEVVQG
ncbi:hypothetical protein HYFRA_00006904 [Hymenoscyphus fraxineus]|uniref:Cytochrome P450 n=1 Tax=Hymenoscyphus fraxineus TaxID=746836 RepID=A0A9N9KNK6_9HELO|nr:hypothetical protein HYFRA_00006904 [Hymenoscyphus fraxineus]